MSTYQRFEDLPIWQEAIVLAELCEDFIAVVKERITWSKRDQLFADSPRRRHPHQLPLRDTQGYAISARSRSVDRASLSVSNNIADEARQRGDGLRRRRWPGAKQRAVWTERPLGGTNRNGFERGTTNELLAFLYIARGSAGEVRSMLCFFERRPALRDFKSQISNLKSVAESCSRQLGAWAQSLQNSDITGPRHLNDKSRANYQKAKARETGAANFEKLLAQHLPRDHPQHPNNRLGR